MAVHTISKLAENVALSCWKFSSLSSSERTLKIRQESTKLSPWVWCTTFWGHYVE